MASLALGLAGCTELPEVAYETEHLEIAPDFEHPICAGTLTQLDEHVAYLESSLGRALDPGERIRVYWIEDDIGAWCSEGAGGCFYPGSRVLFANGQSLTHELVHAVLDAEAETSLFLEEGLAEVYSGVGVSYGAKLDTGDSLAEHMWLTAQDYRRGALDYGLAAHFIAYLESTHGSSAIAPIVASVRAGAGPRELDAALRRATGADLAELAQAWGEDGRRHYRGLREQLVPELAVERDDGRAFDVSLRCGEAETFGPLPDGSPGMYRSLRVELGRPALVELELWGPETLRVDVIDVERERSAGKVLEFSRPLVERGDHPRLRGGDRRDLELDAGVHLLMISQPGYDGASASLVARVRTPRPSPTPPV